MFSNKPEDAALHDAMQQRAAHGAPRYKLEAEILRLLNRLLRNKAGSVAIRLGILEQLKEKVVICKQQYPQKFFRTRNLVGVELMFNKIISSEHRAQMHPSTEKFITDFREILQAAYQRRCDAKQTMQSIVLSEMGQRDLLGPSGPVLLAGAPRATRSREQGAGFYTNPYDEMDF